MLYEKIISLLDKQVSLIVDCYQVFIVCRTHMNTGFLYAFNAVSSGEMYCREAAEPLERYWGLKRILRYEVPLSDITADNTYKKIFGVFKELAKR
jgi:hypothetical protein